MGRRTEGVGKVVIGGGIIAGILLLLSKGKGPGLGLSGGNAYGYLGGGNKKPVDIRFTKDGILLNGKASTAEEASEAAFDAKAAVLSATGDAVFGDVEAFEKLVSEKGVAVSKTF